MDIVCNSWYQNVENFRKQIETVDSSRDEEDKDLSYLRKKSKKNIAINFVISIIKMLQ